MKLLERLKEAWKIIKGSKEIQNPIIESKVTKLEAVQKTESIEITKAEPQIIDSTNMIEFTDIDTEIFHIEGTKTKYETFDDFLNHLRPHQKKSFDKIQKNNIGQIFIPTGTGKTWIQKAIHIYDMIRKTKNNETGVYVIVAHRLLLCLQLLDQIVSLANNFNLKYEIVFVGSLDYKDTVHTILPEEIDAKIKKAKENNQHVIIASTYHSFDNLLIVPKIDVCTFDEAHNTVSQSEKETFKENIKKVQPNILRQYYFTATPKALGEEGGQKDEGFYGPPLHIMSPKEAIEKGEIVQPIPHVIEIDGDYSEIDKNNIQLYIRTIVESFIEHEKQLNNIAAKLLVTGKNLLQIHSICGNPDFQKWSKDNNIKVFMFSSGSKNLPCGPFIDFEKKSFNDTISELDKLKLDLKQKAIFFHFDILSEGIDVPNMTGVLIFRDLEDKIRKFTQNIGRCCRLLEEDRKRLYSGIINPLEVEKMIKPYSYVIIPSYYCKDSNKYQDMLKILTEIYEIPFDIIISQNILGNKKIQKKMTSKEIKEFSENKEWTLTHIIQKTHLDIIRENLDNKFNDPKIDKEKFLFDLIEEVYNDNNILLEATKIKLKESYYFKRNNKARKECIDYYGTFCQICGADLKELYGEEATNIIEVHHRDPLFLSKGIEREVNPKKDLIPVCSNCHTILHIQKPYKTFKEVICMLYKIRGNNEKQASILFEKFDKPILDPVQSYLARRK
jgi:superfamily II DNA or RNA helicase